MGMGMKAGTGTGNGTEFKPDSRALPDAADFDLYLIVCKQRAEYPTVCMEYGWMVRQTHTKRDPPTDSLNIYRIHMYVCCVCAVTYAGDLFDFWHEVDRLLQIELSFAFWGWMMMMTKRPSD